MKEARSSLGRQRIAVVAARFVDAFCAMVALRIGTTYMAPSEYGKLMLYLAFMQGIVWLLLSPFQNYLLVNARGMALTGSLRRSIRKFAVFAALIALTSSIVVYMLRPHIQLLRTYGDIQIALLGVNVLTSILSQTIIPSLNILGLRYEYSIVSSAISVCALLASWMLVAAGSHDFFSWQAGQVLAQLVVSGCAVIVLARVSGRSEPGRSDTASPGQYRPIAYFVLPLMASVPLQWFYSQGYRLLLDPLFTAHDIALFLVGFGMGAKFFNVAEKVMFAVYQPVIYGDTRVGWSRQDSALVLRAVSIYAAVGLLLAGLKSPLFELLVAREYHDAAQFFVLGMIYDLGRCSINFMSQYFMREHKNGYAVAVNAAICGTFLAGYAVLRHTHPSLSTLQFVLLSSIAAGFVLTAALVRTLRSPLRLSPSNLGEIKALQQGNLR